MRLPEKEEDEIMQELCAAGYFESAMILHFELIELRLDLQKLKKDNHDLKKAACVLANRNIALMNERDDLKNQIKDETKK